MGSNADDLGDGGSPPVQRGGPPVQGGQQTFDREYVTQLRSENASWRIKYQGVKKALGLPDDADLATVNNALEARVGEVRSLKVDKALSESFLKHGANPRLTRAVFVDSGQMAKFDPNAADFEEVIDTAVTEAVHEMPALRGGANGPAAVRGGGQFNGPGAPQTSKQLARDEIAAMTPDQVTKALKEGKLDALLGRGH
jgi:hypothetical protein